MIFMLISCLLLPVFMIGFGNYFKKGKPETPNWAFGYRTSMSMKNLDTWQFAHVYCGKLWVWIGFVMLFLTAGAMLFVIGREQDTVEMVGGIVVSVQLIPLIGTIFWVEKELRRNFEKDGSRKSLHFLQAGGGRSLVNDRAQTTFQKGTFITFEGIEGSGKSTQVKILQEALLADGHEVLVTREPGGPPISEKIREILLDPENHEMTPETEVLLYIAARNQHTAQWILPALEKGSIIICDRYTESTLAYQGMARKLNIDDVLFINNFATYGLKPDITFVIDIPVKLSRERLQGKKLDRIEAERVKFHEAVRQAFLEIATHLPSSVKSGDTGEINRYIVIDGQKDIKKIQKEIYQKVVDIL